MPEEKPLELVNWEDETLHLANGIWTLEPDGSRLPNGKMLEAIKLAREYGYFV